MITGHTNDRRNGDDHWSRNILGWRQDFLRWEQLCPEAPILKPSRISWNRTVVIVKQRNHSDTQSPDIDGCEIVQLSEVGLSDCQMVLQNSNPLHHSHCHWWFSGCVVLIMIGKDESHHQVSVVLVELHILWPLNIFHHLNKLCHKSKMRWKIVRSSCHHVQKSSYNCIIMSACHHVNKVPPDGQSLQVFHASHGGGRARTHKPHTAGKSSHSPGIQIAMWIRIYPLYI